MKFYEVNIIMPRPRTINTTNRTEQAPQPDESSLTGEYFGFRLFVFRSDVYDIPVPGIPTCAVVPLAPNVIPAPRLPIEVLTPFFPKFSLTPGAIFIVLLNLSPIFAYILYVVH